MKKRWTALLLICCILASVTMSMAEESGINWTEEDRAKIWDNKQAWNKLNVFTGLDLIDAVLKAGEKDAIYDKIEEIFEDLCV